jgi:hypothetical protein
VGLPNLKQGSKMNKSNAVNPYLGQTRFKEAIIKGAHRALVLASELVLESCMFVVVPLPDDEYEFYVKPEMFHWLTERISIDQALTSLRDSITSDVYSYAKTHSKNESYLYNNRLFSSKLITQGQYCINHEWIGFREDD